MQDYAFPAQNQRGRECCFWKSSNKSIARREGADPMITYMRLMYKKAKEKGVRVAAAPT